MAEGTSGKFRSLHLLAVLPLLLLALFFMIGWFRKVGNCTGWNAIAGMILLLLAFFLYLFVAGIFWLIRYFRTRENRWLTPLYWGLGIAALVVISLLSPQDVFRSKVVLEATLGTSHSKLKLRRDSSYQAEIRSIDGTCYHYGAYSWQGDTLLLHNDIENRSQRFRDKYLQINTDSLKPLVPDSVAYPRQVLLVIKPRKKP